jgi:sugar phosphate isomerase/epimerase
MKIGVYSDSLGHLPLADCLDFCAARGIERIEFGTGNWSSAPHLDLAGLLSSPARRDELLAEVRSRGLSISALNCSGNPLHPADEGARHAEVVRDTIRLAALLGIDRIVTMSGLPEAPGDSHPNWIVSSWPPETTRILSWQWAVRLIPYWSDVSAFARAHGVRPCLEMHGAQCVYNVEAFERLNEAVGDGLWINFDPSHLLWMGADPLAAVRRLGSRIAHAHAKDTRLEAAAALNGRLDAKPVVPVAGRSWNFVAVGRGQDAAFWTALVEALRSVGYDDVLSIENEDYSLSAETAVDQAIAYLKPLVGRT